MQYTPDLLSCALYYTDALDSTELSVSNILCLCPIDGPCLFQLKEFFYSFPFYIKTRRLHRRSLRLPTRRKWAKVGGLGVLICKYGIEIEHMKQKELFFQYHRFSACVDADYDIKENIKDIQQRKKFRLFYVHQRSNCHLIISVSQSPARTI